MSAVDLGSLGRGLVGLVGQAEPAAVGITWTPGIGDPTPMGWVTVLAYLATAALALRAFALDRAEQRRSRAGSVRGSLLWLLLGLLLLLLGLNKQLDLQSLLTDVGRVLAHRQGWYEQRQKVQVAFIGAVLVVGVLGLLVIAWLARGRWDDYGLALGGMVFLLGFIVVRASSFHRVDQLIGLSLGGVRVNWVFELAGIGLVAAAAGIRVHRARTRGRAGAGRGPHAAPRRPRSGTQRADL